MGRTSPGDTSYWQYDAMGQVVASTDPLGLMSAAGYDAMGRQVSVTDPALNATRAAFDAFGRLGGIVNAFDQGASYTYDDYLGGGVRP